MDEQIVLDEKNMITMKLLHYFITEKNYNPIILQGVDNEIWLENLDEDCKVIRIVSNYIHNDEQFDFDVFKTKRILKKIKKKTFSFRLNVMSIFLSMGDNITEDINADPNLMCINVKDEKDISKSKIIKEIFPDLSDKLKYSEEGVELFMKITGDINKHNKEDATRLEKVFKSKVPYITYFLIAVNCIFYFVPLILGQYQYVIDTLCVHGPSIRAGQYYRLLTGIVLHGSLMHLFFNCYSLYVIGSQIESFLGKFKYLIIYIFAGLTGSLLSITMSGGVASVGASGAIFGLMGALLYFGYYYRVYLGNVVKSQILPLIVLNLLFGFFAEGIDNAAHIGGLIGGIIITMALGVKDKSSTFEKVNGWIIAFIFLAFLSYMGIVMAGR
ncbi:MAG: rhomboid family intramembrane serine protease [Bacilli bacterium]|nr:rhomboid family intramembrane serine protease [Bacilli bacterium]